MKNIVIVNGYARSGKTTFMTIARDMGYAAISTSDILSEVCDTMLSSLFGLAYDSKDKSDTIEVKCATKNGNYSYEAITSRDLKIKMAEDVLRPILGEDVLVRASAKHVERTFDRNETVFIELINEKEVDLFLHSLKTLKGIKLHTITIRSEKELVGVDLREPLDGYLAYAVSDVVIHNDYTNDYYQQVTEYIDNYLI